MPLSHVAQQGDSDITPILGWLETSLEAPKKQEVAECGLATQIYIQQWDVLRLRDGVLYRRWESADELRVIHQLVLPHSHRRVVIQTAHGQGNFGIERTYELIQRSACWARWQHDVKLELARCDACA